MIIKFTIPVLAIAGFGFAVSYVARTRPSWPSDAPLVSPPQTPFHRTVAGAGIVEAETENIAVGSPTAGVVAEVPVTVGDAVKAGMPLFRLDDRQATAELAVREAALAAAQAELARLTALPRPEQTPLFEARVRQAEAELADRKWEYERLQPLVQDGNAADFEFSAAEKAYNSSIAKLEEARADLALHHAGAWQSDILVAEAAVKQAEAQVGQARIELDRLTVRALTDGLVLRVSIRPGEFAGAVPGQALILLGSVDALHVRVDIDEFDIPRFSPQAKACAMLKGRTDLPLDLQFVRIEPYVTPKRSLTGENTERVDTRVMQVIYAVRDDACDLLVGQQVDVFIEARPDASLAVSAPEIASGG